MRLFKHLSPWYVLSLRLAKRSSVSSNRLLFVCVLFTYPRIMLNIFFSKMHTNAIPLTQIECAPIFCAAKIASARHIANWIAFSWRFITAVSFGTKWLWLHYARIIYNLIGQPWPVSRRQYLRVPMVAQRCSLRVGGVCLILIFHWSGKNSQQKLALFCKKIIRLPLPFCLADALCAPD